MRPPRPPISPSAAIPPRVSTVGGASGDAEPAASLVTTPASESGVSTPVKFDDTDGDDSGVVAENSIRNSNPRKHRSTKKNYKKSGIGGVSSKQGRSRPPTALERKAEQIESVLSQDDVDLWRLRELALTEGGLVNDSIRKRAWPKLVGIHNEGTVFDAIGALDESISAAVGSGGSGSSGGLAGIAVIDPINLDSAKVRRGVVARCLDAEQIDRDIARCTWHLLTGSQRQRRRNMAKIEGKSQRMESLLKKKQRRLGNLINLVLVQSYDSTSNEDDEDDDRLRYYQGYHDVSCIFLNVLGGASVAAGAPGSISAEMASRMKGSPRSVDQAALAASAMGLDLPSSVLLQISRSHFRDAMRSDFQSLSAALRLIMMPLIAALDREVHAKLWEVDMEPFFAISWIITWFSHDVRDTDLVKRLFDCFLVSHPLMPVYMAVAMLLHPVNRMEIIHAESEFSAVHNAITHLPRNSCSVGWRYQGGIGGGYVSDDGDGPDEDDTTLGSSTMGEASFFSDDFSSSEAVNGMDLEDDSSIATSQAPSMASASIYSARGPPRVPFESLIDLSLSFMRRIPPRKLVPLSKRYFLDDAIQPLLAQSSSIAFLKPPPSWALSPVAPSDEVLRQRSLGQAKPSSTTEIESTEEKESTRSMIPQVDEKAGHIKLVSSEGARVQTVQAVIASGMGPDGDTEARLRKRRRKRKMQLMAAVGVGVLAVAIALMRSRGATVPSDTAKPESRITQFGDDADECMAGSAPDEIFITQSRDATTGKLNINVHSESSDQSFEVALPRMAKGSGSSTLAKISKNFAQVVLSHRKQVISILQDAVPFMKNTVRKNAVPFMKNTVHRFQAFLSEEGNIFLMD